MRDEGFWRFFITWEGTDGVHIERKERGWGGGVKSNRQKGKEAKEKPQKINILNAAREEKKAGS